MNIVLTEGTMRQRIRKPSKLYPIKPPPSQRPKINKNLSKVSC